jgi:hypothetical protein
MSSPEHGQALRDALLAELATHPEGISLPRLCKRLGVRMSVLMRELAWLGEAPIGDMPGAGMVRVAYEGERAIARLAQPPRDGRAELD